MSTTVIGFDLGGTKSAISLYDTDLWTAVAHESMPTNAHLGLPAVMDNAAAMIAKFRRDDTVAVGFGMPGLIRHADGSVAQTPNIPGGENFPAKQFLEKQSKLPVFVDNDARCFTLAEAKLGAGKGHSVVIGITMGTGVGGGVAMDGKLFHGAHGFAGEIGHMLLIPGQPPVGSKHTRGDVEQFLSGTSLGRRCEPAEKPEDYLDGHACAFLWADVFREIAWMLCNLTHMFDPSVIVFGGSTGRALRPHLKNIGTELGLWLLPGMPIPTLTIAERQDAGSLGAALLTQ
ncbi:ROK family protein [Candidatus Peribacteria bacterium]|nr:ROK family protein [Candidatus Peribacteria bacterium]